MKTISEDQQVSSKVKPQRKCSPLWTIQLRTLDCPVAHQIVWCHMVDCLVHQGTVAQQLVPGGTMEESH
jgi:hypothetical protein